MPSRETLGLIGLGLLGSAIASRMRIAGFPVLGFDVDEARRTAFADSGGSVAASPQEIATGCMRIVLCLPDSRIVGEVVESIEGRLRPRTLLIDTTTGDPADVVRLADRLAARDVRYVDATVGGSSATAADGRAAVTVGGEAEDVDRARDVLQTFAERVFHVGPVGAGSLAKLSVNLVLGLNRAALAEGLAFAERSGLDVATMLEVLAAGPAASEALRTKGRKMIDSDFEPQARLAQHAKDVRLIVDQADRVGARTPFSEAHRALLEELVAGGLGDVDNAAIIEAFRRA